MGSLITGGVRVLGLTQSSISSVYCSEHNGHSKEKSEVIKIRVVTGFNPLALRGYLGSGQRSCVDHAAVQKARIPRMFLPM